MAKCSRCRQRKAKRSCPALGEELCSLCCGRHRLRDIPCPPGCPFLKGASPAPDRRDREKAEAEFWRDERLVWLAHNASRPLRVLAERLPSFTDEDAVRAMEYAREETLQAQRLILAPD
ncbi:MAG: hypothetical protein FJY83_11580, partial [Candidatus Aminicenantes bacterium]|nr:hypothetical protein [Candidatus Aminicenantes bacterium]